MRYYSDSVMLVAQLTDTADGAIVWSKTHESPAEPDAGRRGHIAFDLARSLLDPFGVIQAHERIRLAAVDPMRDAYRCILDANFYLRSFDPSQYQSSAIFACAMSP